MRDVARGNVEWIRRYDMRIVSGSLPGRWDGEDHGLSDSLLWVCALCYLAPENSLGRSTELSRLPMM